MRWPWQRQAAERPTPAGPAPAPAPAGWSFLPPLQRTVGSIELVSAPAAFPGRLAAWSDPSFVAPSIGSGRRLDGPSGIIELDAPERRGPTVLSRSVAGSEVGVVRAAPVINGASTSDLPDEDTAAPDLSGPDGTAAAEEVDPPAPAPEAVSSVESPTAVLPAATVAARLPEPLGPSGPVGSGPVRPTAQRLQQAVQRGEGSGVSGVRRSGPAVEPTAAPAPIPVQRVPGPAGAVVRPMDPRRIDHEPTASTSGSQPGDAPSTATPGPIPEPQLDLPSSLPPTASAGSDSTGPMVQRARLDPLAPVHARAAGPSDLVAATDAPARQPSSAVLAAVAPGVLQRAPVVPQAVRSVDPGSRRGGHPDLPVASMRATSEAAPVPTGPSVLAEPLTLGEPVTAAGPIQHDPPTWSPLPTAPPRASATVVELQRRPRESDDAPSGSARWLDRAPVSIGGTEVGESGSGRRPVPTLRFGEPSQQHEAVGGQAVQRLAVARSWPEPDTGSAAMHPQVLRSTGRVGSPVTREDAVVQRAESDVAEPAAAPPEPPAMATPPAGGVPAASTTGGASAAPPQAPTSREDLDRLAASLMPALLWRIKAELVTERERRGVRSDRF